MVSIGQDFSVFRFQLNVFPLVGFLWLNFTEATRLWQITDSFFHLTTSLQSKLLLLGINRQPVGRSLLLSPDGGPGTGPVLHQVGQVCGGGLGHADLSQGREQFQWRTQLTRCGDWPLHRRTDYFLGWRPVRLCCESALGGW